MNWYKEIIVDICVTLFIILAVLLDVEWMKYVLLGYSILLLVIKLIVYWGDGFRKLLNKKPQTVPPSVIYQLYGVNIAFLILFDWWMAAAIWLLIGLISYLTDKKMITPGPLKKNAG